MGCSAKASYGVRVPLLGLERICPAYGNTASGLVDLGHMARRWKAEKAADR